MTGATGQLSLSLAERAAVFPQLHVSTVGRPTVHFEQPDALRDAILQHRPEVLINAAAYTAVDQAEVEPELAELVNAKAPGVLACAAAELGIPIIHLSTDYVFDGTGTGPYAENALTAPKSVYGRTKLAGEEAVRFASPMAMIVRTSWVYSPFGRNFVKTMLALAETRDEIGVVADQFGTPTSALGLADGLLTAVCRWRDGERTGQGETYHLAGQETASWYDVARAIFAYAAELSLPTATVRPIATADYPTRAARPANSALDSGKFARDFSFGLVSWQESVRQVVDRIASAV